MTTIETTSRTGPDGVLVLRIPVGVTNTDMKVKVELDTIPSSEARLHHDRDEWKRFVAETAGAWKGDLERPEA